MKFLAAVIVALVMFGAMGAGAALAHPVNGHATVDSEPLLNGPIFSTLPNFPDQGVDGIVQGFVFYSPQCLGHGD